MSDVKPVNVELFQKVKAAILAEPSAFRMSVFMGQAQSSCGTAMCIAGWANLIDRGKVPTHFIERDSHEFEVLSGITDNPDRAAEALGLNDDYMSEDAGPFDCQNVFYSNYWKEPFRTRYRSLSGVENSAQRAQVAAEYIDWICETYGPKTTLAEEPPPKEETWHDRPPMI